MMTLCNIGVLLHYHVSPDQHPSLNAPAVRESVDMLLDNGLIDGSGGLFSTTGKGRAFVDMICKTPMPVRTWTDPREEK